MLNPSGETFGIGVDIESIARFSNPDIANNTSFLDKVFTQKELAYCNSNPIPEQHLAVRFAGKEAIIKALADFGEDRPGYHDIEITNDENCAPCVIIVKKGFDQLSIHLSLAHAQDMALAFAVITRSDKRNSV